MRCSYYDLKINSAAYSTWYPPCVINADSGRCSSHGNFIRPITAHAKTVNWERSVVFASKFRLQSNTWRWRWGNWSAIKISCEKVVLDIRIRAFCRVAVSTPSMLAYLHLLSRFSHRTDSKYHPLHRSRVDLGRAAQELSDKLDLYAWRAADAA